MKPTVTIDLNRLNSELADYAKSLQLSLADAVKKQARLLLRDLVRATPPFGKHTFTESFTEQRRIGEAATKRDINRTMQFLGDVMFIKYMDTTAAKSIRRYIREFAVEPIKKIIAHWTNAEVFAFPRPDWHTAQRVQGRVRKHARLAYVLDKASLQNYIAAEVNQVGRAKGGWARAAMNLGVELPEWITRHADTPNVYSDELLHTNPSITVGNLVEYALDFPNSPFDAAVENRINGMENEIIMTVAYLNSQKK